MPRRTVEASSKDNDKLAFYAMQPSGVEKIVFLPKSVFHYYYCTFCNLMNDVVSSAFSPLPEKTAKGNDMFMVLRVGVKNFDHDFLAKNTAAPSTLCYDLSPKVWNLRKGSIKFEQLEDPIYEKKKARVQNWILGNLSRIVKDCLRVPHKWSNKLIKFKPKSKRTVTNLY